MTDVDVRLLRSRLGWSQSQLAKFLSVADSTVARWDVGDRRPTGTAGELVFALQLATDKPVGVERLKKAEAAGETLRSLIRRWLTETK